MDNHKRAELQIQHLLAQTKGILKQGVILHEEGRVSTLQGPEDALRFLLGKGASILETLEDTEPTP